MFHSKINFYNFKTFFGEEHFEIKAADFLSCRKGKVIEMKRKDTVEGVSRKLEFFELNGKTFFKGLGAKLSIVIAGVLTVGAVSITAIADFEAIPPSDVNAQASTTTIQSDPKTAATTVPTIVSWWKAGVSEYDLSEAEEVTEPVTTVTQKTSETTTTVKKERTTVAEKSSENKTTVKKERTTVKETATVAAKTNNASEKEKKTAKKDNKKTKVKSADKKTTTTIVNDVLYVQEDVKLRKKPSTSADVIKIVKQGEKVNVTGKEKNGFYPVKIGNKSGYIMSSYLDSKPSKVTTTENSVSKEYIGTFKITAYSASSSAKTASGTSCKAGRTIAAPSRFDFGTKLMFNGNVYTVEDRGSAIVNNVLDLYVDSNSEAVKWGVRYLKVYKVND